MKSTDLAKHGFGSWFPFNRNGERALVTALPLRPGVYAIRCCRDYQRTIGTSDILYFGVRDEQQRFEDPSIPIFSSRSNSADEQAHSYAHCRLH
jgi:hypothetical protein